MKRNLLITMAALALTGAAAHAVPTRTLPAYRIAAASESDLLVQGIQQGRDKAHADAIETFSELLRRDPKNQLAVNFRAGNYTALGNYAAAMADYERLLAIETSDTNKVRAHLGRGEVYRRQARLDQALAEFEGAIGLLRSMDSTAQMAYLHPAHFGRARVYAAQGKTALARADFQLITANRFTATKDYLEEAGRFEARVQQEAGEQVKLAMIKGEQQDFKGAKDALDACIRIEPRALICYVYRAQAQTRLGSPEPALADLSHAIGLNPKEPQVYYVRAQIYANTGKRDLAIADLRQALRLKPDFKEAADGLRQMGATP